ncbi:MAG: hypothetical protein QOD69_2681 [Solirubrobacteraceae bacterium]|nr:hypothetical protein [Solirubrobacteraceae bacterium]
MDGPLGSQPARSVGRPQTGSIGRAFGRTLTAMTADALIDAYRDPSVAVDGRGAFSEHHGWLRFGWRMLDPAGQVVLEGQDIGERGCDGLLRRIVGFFGPPPPVDVAPG